MQKAITGQNRKSGCFRGAPGGPPNTIRRWGPLGAPLQYLRVGRGPRGPSTQQLPRGAPHTPRQKGPSTALYEGKAGGALEGLCSRAAGNVLGPPPLH
ncbi:hypothetical protein Emed_006467 [Eimeria media]